MLRPLVTVMMTNPSDGSDWLRERFFAAARGGKLVVDLAGSNISETGFFKAQAVGAEYVVLDTFPEIDEAQRRALSDFWRQVQEGKR